MAGLARRIDFINNIVVDGLAGVITVSFGIFLDQIDPEHIARLLLPIWRSRWTRRGGPRFPQE